MEDHKEDSKEWKLYLACRQGEKSKVLKLLKEDGADPRSEDATNTSTGGAPLHWASHHGWLDIVKDFIENYNISPELATGYHETPLHCACQGGHIDIVRYLLKEKGCDAEIRNADQRTPLHYASQYGHLDVVKYFLNELNTNAEVQDEDKRTPLHYASQHGHLDIVKYIVGERGCDPLIGDEDRRTPLHNACFNGHKDIAEYFITERKCDPEIADCRDWTPLHRACVTAIASEEKSLELVQYLINVAKCDLTKTNEHGNNALHLACISGKTSVVKFLCTQPSCDPRIENCFGANAISQTLNPEIIKMLIQRSATAAASSSSDTYRSQGRVLGTNQPLQPSVKVFVVGNPTAGKSTLTAALQKEASFLLRTFITAKRVSEVDEKTAGVIPHEFESKKYGRITIYDFAGHREFYNSHAALLQNAVQFSPPIFLLVVDLTEGNKEFKDNILYWLSFLENQCTSADSKPHVIVVGSHLDVLEARGEDLKEKASVVDSLRSNHFKNLEYAGFVAINCQYPESTGMTDLRLCLKNSCDQLRRQETINFSAHCLQTFLINKFQDRTALRINAVKDALLESQQSASSLQRFVTFIPTNIHLLCGVCNELNDRGHILFLGDSESIESSWVIMNKEVLLSEVTGTIFAPEGFKQHCQLATSTGVVPFIKIANQFQQHNPEMLVGFLSHLEFCHEISDKEVLQLISDESGFSAAERYFFFPGLVRLSVPREVWDPQPSFKFHSGWVLKCSRPEQFFTARFFQVLLLRLAFEFAFPHHKEEEEEGHEDFPAIRRKCSVWKNGIYWGNRDGVEVLAEIVEQNKALVLLFRCHDVTPECLQLRSKIIQKALKAVEEFCSKVKTVESFIDPSEIVSPPPQIETTSSRMQSRELSSTRSVPRSLSEMSQHQTRSHVKPTSELSLFPLSEIATAIVEGKSSVLTKQGKPHQLDVLLCFEPYASIGRYNLCKMFNEDHPEYVTRIPKTFPLQIPVRNRYRVVELLNPSPPSFQAAAERADRVTRMNDTFKKWRDSCDGTYHCLHQKLDQFSIFAMKNILVSVCLLDLFLYTVSCMFISSVALCHVYICSL